VTRGYGYVSGMAGLTRLAGLIADVALGLPVRAAPYEIREDVPVPMPDGVMPLANHYRPTGQDGPLPVVLIRVPYGRAGTLGQLFAAPLARRGLQVFVQATRGTFGSGGQFRPFTTERDDGLATLAWLRAQPWCDGRVAMTGGSYFRHTQWAVAPYADPPLICVSPHITSANVTRTLFYDHGVPQIHTALSWSAQIGRQERPALLGGLPDPRAKARVHRASAGCPRSKLSPAGGTSSWPATAACEPPGCRPASSSGRGCTASPVSCAPSCVPMSPGCTTTSTAARRRGAPRSGSICSRPDGG
jgi:predicted acyl esterase